MSKLLEKTAFANKIWKVVSRIPQGRVATYALVAYAARRPRAWRAVGNILHKNPFRRVPCHRVIRSDGNVGGFTRGTKEKVNLLRREGVKIFHKKVDRPAILKSI